MRDYSCSFYQRFLQGKKVSISAVDYTREYFIDKFEKVPEWYFKKHCALEQCGVDMEAYEPTEESTALILLFGGRDQYDYAKVYDVNDWNFPSADWSPKQNILNRLRSINV